MDRLETDVLIVGAGPTGLTLANFLGGFGVRTLLVERNASTVDEPRAVSIDDELMRTMQAIGLDQSVLGIVARAYGSRYMSPRREVFASVDPLSQDYGFDKRNAFEQPVLEKILRDGLIAILMWLSASARNGCPSRRIRQASRPNSLPDTVFRPNSSSAAMAAVPLCARRSASRWWAPLSPSVG